MKRIFFGALVALGILFPLTFAPAQDRGLPASADLGLPQDTIIIQIVADADSVVAVPNSVTVSRGQVVTWACELGEWRVNFKSGQPFGDQAVGDGIRGNQGQISGQAVRNNAAAGTYKYDIMVQVRGGPPLRADPEIVINPEEQQ